MKKTDLATGLIVHTGLQAGIEEVVNRWASG